MAGSPKTLTINGTRFPITADAEPKVVKGGRYKSDDQVFGNGTSHPIEDVMSGKTVGIMDETVAPDDADTQAVSLVVPGIAQNMSLQANLLGSLEKMRLPEYALKKWKRLIEVYG